jgi:hypothetical protein
LLRADATQVPRFLDVAAVLGDQVDVAVLAAVLDQPISAVASAADLAVDAGIMRPAGPDYAFVHALMREAIYGDLRPAHTPWLALGGGPRRTPRPRGAPLPGRLAGRRRRRGRRPLPVGWATSPSSYTDPAATSPPSRCSRARGMRRRVLRRRAMRRCPAGPTPSLTRRARLRDERDALVHEITAVFGLGGRPRRLGPEAERARLNVTRAIRTAISNIAAQAPELGAHLDATLSTGTRCRYDPPD